MHTFEKMGTYKIHNLPKKKKEEKKIVKPTKFKKKMIKWKLKKGKKNKLLGSVLATVAVATKSQEPGAIALRW